MSKLIFTLICLSALGGAIPCQAKIIYVDDDGPADFNNIQAAIDDCNDGDEIVARDGVYTGDGNRDIDFKGKAITLRSENGPEKCIIDCQANYEDLHRGFYFHSGEDVNSILDGFTITNGYALDGGGIYSEHSSPMVTRCILTENQTYINGAGLYITNSSLTLSNCIFSSNYAGYFGGGIYCVNGSPKITNNTFLNNSAHWGGGIFRGTGMAIITDNVFTGNHADYGGGICCRYGATPVITNCTIAGNSGEGGGIFSSSSHPIITNNIIVGNFTSHSGGGISCYDSATITNNVITDNHSRNEGGGIYCGESELRPAVTNCILWGNTTEESTEEATQIYGSYPNYSCIEDWKITFCGIGNIDSDPYFADPNNGDYHLKSPAGRWDVNEGRWAKDEVTSPCIDAGDPASPIGLEPFPNGGIINMGAYGGTAEASKSYFGEPVCETIMAGDINGDCVVNFKDFALMAFHWLEEH